MLTGIFVGIVLYFLVPMDVSPEDLKKINQRVISEMHAK
jgi:hypothetical protein